MPRSACWECVDPPAGGNGTTFLLSMRFHSQYRPAIGLDARNLKTSLTSYGHIYETIERFYSCAHEFLPRLPAASSQAQTPRFIVPSSYRGKPVFFELATLLHGSMMAVERVDDLNGNVTLCGRGAGTCCNQQHGELPSQYHSARHAQLVVGWHATTSIRTKRRLRATAWSNLGLSQSPVDTVTFVRAAGSNGRRLARESEVAQRVRAFVAAHEPALRFEWVDISALPFRAELALLRRTRVFISVFGSSLHGCRWLPPECIVVEIRGALKRDWRESGYATLCAQEMGLRWLPVAAEGALPQPLPAGTLPALPRRAGSTLTAWPDFRAFRYPRGNDTSHTAYVDPATVTDVLSDALRGDWRGALARYPLRVFGSLSQAEWLAGVHGQRREAGLHWTAERLLRLPQFSPVAHAVAG